MQNTQPGVNSAPISACYVLAIDLGSGGPKVALVSDTGEIIASRADRVTTFLLPHGGAEQDPEEWWTRIQRAAKGVIRESGVSPEKIVAVGCTSQWSVLVSVDEQGKPLMNAVHWLDTRGGVHNRAITRGIPSLQGYGLSKLYKWIKLTGLVPTHSGVDSMGHILFVKNERPDIYQRVHKFLEPVDYLTYRLTGKFTASQHTVAPMLLVDARTWSCLDYSDDLLKLAGLERAKFPQLIPNDGIIGPVLPSVAKEWGLLPTTQVMVGTNDTNAEAIGAGAVRDFEGIIYIGTSLVLTCHLPFKRSDLLHTMTTLPSPIKSKYLLMAEQGTGGKCLDFYLRNIVYADDEFDTGPMPDDVYDRLNRMAVRVPAGSEGVLFLPWLNGTIAPEENATARGGFFNLSLSSTRSHMTRALMEGIAFNNRWTLEPAEKLVGREFDHFRFAGGGALSDVWAQIHADVLDVPIHRVADPTHTPVRGAAFLAFASLGLRSLEQLADLVKIDQVFAPDGSNRAVYDRLYGQYRLIYQRNKKIFSALNSHGQIPA